MALPTTLPDQSQHFHPLAGLSVVELAEWICGPYCAKLLADLGASVYKIEALPDGDLSRQHDAGLGPAGLGKVYGYLNQNKSGTALDPADQNARERVLNIVAEADVVLISPEEATKWQLDVRALSSANPQLVVVSVTPFGLTGPAADARASDLTLWHEGGYGYGFPGLVADADRLPPLNGPGNAASHLAAVAAASAVLDGVMRRDDRGRAPLIDFSQLEAVASVQFGAIVDGQHGVDRTRRSVPGAAPVPAVAILRCSDGTVAMSPREHHQWLKWVEAMGNPAWSTAERFATNNDREKNWDELWANVEVFTRARTVSEVYRLAQKSRVPCLPLHTLDTVNTEPQLQYRGFFRTLTDGSPELYPTAPFHLDGVQPPNPTPAPRLGAADAPTRRVHPPAAAADRALPLTGLRILDLSWVLTGPTCTRLLGQLGAEVVKVESRKRPDLSSRDWIYPSLHTGKKSCTLNLSTEEGRELVLGLVAQSDVLVENFSTGVMERLGLSEEALRAVNPKLLIVSSSPFGRFGPSASDLAYGSLIQSFVGWGELSRYVGEAEHRFGAIWGDPLSGMTLAYIVLAMVYARRHGDEAGHRIDLSMAEGMIAALSVPYVESLVSGRAPTPMGNRDLFNSPQGVYRAPGDDEWIAVTVDNISSWHALCSVINRPDWQAVEFDTADARRERADEIDEAIGAWAAERDVEESVARLRSMGVIAAAVAKPTRLVKNPQLNARGFFLRVEDSNDPLVAGLSWLVDGAERPATTRSPEVGEDNDYVFGSLLGLDAAHISDLEERQVIY